MPIIYNSNDKRFILETNNTEYAFSIMYGKFLIHEYYGVKRTDKKQYYTAPIRAFSTKIDGADADFTLTDSFLEFPFFGNGDYRCSSLRIKGKTGDSCTCFYYKNHEITEGRKEIPGIPCARPLNNTETLIITLYDEVTECTLKLYYSIFPDCDVITRYFTLENASDEAVTIQKAMCLSLDIEGHDFDMISLYGYHGHERNVQRVPLSYGNHSIMSRRGASGHQFNPFIALAAKGADEENGEVYAFNLVYSGSFLDEVEVNTSGNTRVAIGLGEENFKYTLKPSETFDSPEAVMLYSPRGIGDMSRKMHRFVRNAISPKEISANRPIVLNTWESCLFDINENMLIDFAKEAVKYGMDTLVMDDGWFGQRNGDRAGLGDWYANKDKFPNGLKNLVLRVKEIGMKFGIWIEPEMVNPDSDLYRAHPEWCLNCRERKPSLSRHQLVLDLCNPEVRDYLKNSFLETLGDVPIDYIKWDFNRNLSEVGSYYLDNSCQEEAWYRYQLGVYDMYYWFRKTFPNVIIENCSGGGGRYDLAMMALSTQIWTSDNTNAADRVKIQYGSTIGYPASVMSCHVSEPGDDEECMERLRYKYHTALGGILGYEFNITKTSQQVKNEILKQTAFYREVEDLIKCGDQYRLLLPTENDCEAYAYYYTASEDMDEQAGERIFVTYLQNKGTDSENAFVLKIPSADENALYTDKISGEKFSGRELKDGLSVAPSKKNEFSIIRYLVK